MRRRFPLWVLAGVFFTSADASEPGEFVSRRCLDCHDDASAKGGLSFENLDDKIGEENSRVWLKILQQVERRAMPPADEEQPSKDERQAMEAALEERLARFAQTRPTEGETVLRRLNRTEYRNTIRDLFETPVDGFDPTREFPEDTHVHGFPTNGEKLVTSGFLLRQYLEAAEKIVARTRLFGEQPEQRRWELSPPFDTTTKGFIHGESAYYQKVKKAPQPHQSIYLRMTGLPKAGYHPVDALRDGVPESGWYDVRIEAEAKHRHANLDPKKSRFPFLWDASEPIRLSVSSATLQGIDPGNKEALDTAARLHQSGQRDLAIWDLEDDRRAWLECRVWLEKGEFLRLGFPNGPTDANNRLLNYLKDNKAGLLSPEKLAEFEEDYKRGSDWIVPLWFETPRILVSRIELTGPHFAAWPPPSRRHVLGNNEYQSERLESVLVHFASRAWRRPVEKSEVEPFVHLARSLEEEGQEPSIALQEALKGVLCAPSFLYREEKSRDLDDHELAARLSYFIWSSMPDEALRKRADAGELGKPGVLREEALRLLADPKSHAFVEEFAKGWLSLRKLGAMAPDVHRFSAYYDDDLEAAMKLETQLFLQHLLATNGPVDRFLDSDYVFVNRELAGLYRLDETLLTAARGEPVEGLSAGSLVPDGEGRAPSLGFAMVKHQNPWRGGLLGQASVLTVTANGVDTSPVIRGIWILDNLLGAHPPPPPPNVPAVEPDIRGAKSIRDQLTKHRESSSCRTCHQQIDPPGFALESYDPIGRWRGHYVDGGHALPIDTSGEFGRTKFKNVQEFKAELFNRKDLFVRNLADRLLLHALGRELGVADRPALRRIAEDSARDGDRLRDLVLRCVESELFRRK